MRRFLLSLVLLLAGLLSASSVEAGHHHHGGWGGGGYHHHGGWGGGWNGGWGHHHHWGGYHGWGGYGGWGYGGWGYRPYYNYNFYRPWYGGGFYRSYYRPYYFTGGYGLNVGIYNGFYPYGYYGGWGYPTNVYYSAPTYYYSVPATINYRCGIPATYYYSTGVNTIYYGVNNSNPYAYTNYAYATTPSPWLSVCSTTPSVANPSYDVLAASAIVRNRYRMEAPKPAPEAKVFVAKASIDDRARARKFISLGDEAFRTGRYLDALTRYRSAAELAPDLAETAYRKGHAYLANGQYRLAAVAFQEGAKLDSSGHRDGFKLSELYTNEAVKTTHLENLAALATMKADDADAYYLLGVMLKYNGEEARAQKFFAQALKADVAEESDDAITPLRVADVPLRARDL